MSTQKQTAVSGIIDLVKTLLIAGVIAVGFRSFVAEPFNIPSGSMIPTLLVGDYLFVTKYSYGYSRYSFPFGLGPIRDRVFSGERKPQRGQVAVFRLPSDTSVDYIKRVIGLPGGKIHLIQEVSDQQIFDNTPEFVVPAGHYFMMGDNRDNSRDSRSSSVGFVPLKNFIGEAQFLFFSHDYSASIWEIWNWPSAIRFGRLGNTIE